MSSSISMLRRHFLAAELGDRGLGSARRDLDAT
jgi:hypothetical protein